MLIDIVTLFPPICEGAFGESILKRAQEKGLATIRVHNLRDWTRDKHRTADDAPFGGGAGMVMKPEPIFEAIEALKAGSPAPEVLFMSPAGDRLGHDLAADYAARNPHLIILCGHYEGVDQRAIDTLVDREISIGDFVLTNGALAAAVFVDAVVRLIPGVLGDETSAETESFVHGQLDYPQYTRPAEFRGLKVPEILLSGHHGAIEQWRKDQALARTRTRRPDLLESFRSPTSPDPS
jgi:tRNA (guanine37-N1)-methyltransferase